MTTGTASPAAPPPVKSPAAKRSLGQKVCDAILALSPVKSGVVRVEHGTVVSSEEPDANVPVAGHVFLAFIFAAAVLLYFVFSLLVFLSAPPIETITVKPSHSFEESPAMSLRVRAQCTQPPFCGDLTFLSNYSIGSKCALHSSNAAPLVIAAADSGNSSATNPIAAASGIEAPLCYVPDYVYNAHTKGPLDVQGVTIDFGKIVPENQTLGMIEVWTPSAANASGVAQGGFKRVITMDTWQVKMLLIGRNVRYDINGEVTSDELYAKAVQYEGKRPNWRATLIVAADSFVTTTTQARDGSVIEVLADVGGMASLLALALVGLTTVVLKVSTGDAKATPAAKQD